MLRSRNWMALLTGILFILGAIWVAMNPVLNLGVLGLIFAITILVDGIVSTVDYFQRPKPERSGWHLALAILTIIIGISLLGDRFLAQATFIPTLVGFWSIVAGATRLGVGFKAPKGTKGLLIASGILSLLFGFFILFNPISAGIGLVWMFAGLLAYFGALRIIEFFRTPETAAAAPTV